MEKIKDYPMHKSPRCSARSKRTGLPCKSPAVQGWKVCRMHGAGGGAKPGRDNPNYKTGQHTKEALAARLLIRQCREMLSSL